MDTVIELEELRELRDELLDALDEYFDAKAKKSLTFAETVQRYEKAHRAVKEKMSEIKYMREREEKRK